MYTIYDHPLDFPHSFVVRRWTIDGGHEPKPDELPFAVGPSLDAVRDVLPVGLICLPRQEGDEPQVVETWL
jgi:hypothetical protein